MFKFRETAPGAWIWFFSFREQILAQAEEAYTSEGKAKAAAAVFARDVGMALQKWMLDNRNERLAHGLTPRYQSGHGIRFGIEFDAALTKQFAIVIVAFSARPASFWQISASIQFYIFRPLKQVFSLPGSEKLAAVHTRDPCIGIVTDRPKVLHGE